MRRVHGVELSDLEHFPRILRDASMAFLRQATAQSGQHVRLLPVVESALKASGDNKILDLCSGGGGPILFIAEELAKGGAEISLTLSDYYPNEGARYLAETSSIVARYEDQSVDARNISPLTSWRPCRSRRGRQQTCTPRSDESSRSSEPQARTDSGTSTHLCRREQWRSTS